MPHQRFQRFDYRKSITGVCDNIGHVADKEN